MSVSLTCVLPSLLHHYSPLLSRALPIQPGWPTNWERFNDFLPYDGMQNQCRDCSEIPKGREAAKACRQGRQSPIDLQRNITVRRSCKDRHRMNYIKGNCRFDDMDFQVLPHVLRAYQPHNCDVEPNIDFSSKHQQSRNVTASTVSERQLSHTKSFIVSLLCF